MPKDTQLSQKHLYSSVANITVYRRFQTGALKGHLSLNPEMRNAKSRFNPY